MKKTFSQIKTQLVLGYKVLALAFESSPKWASFYFTTSLLNSVVPTIGFYFGKLAIDAVIAKDVFLVVVYALAGLGINTLSSFFSNLASHGYNVLKDILTQHAIAKVLTKAAELDLAYFENAKFHDQLEKVQREIYFRPYQALDVVVEGSSAFFGAISLSLLLFKLAWWAPFILIILSIPRLIYRLKFSYYTYSIIDNRSPENRKVSQIVWLLTHKDAAAEIKIFQVKNYFLKIFKDINNKFIAENKNLSAKQNVYSFLLDLLGNISYVFLSIITAFQTIAGKLTLGDLTMLMGAIRQYQSVLQGIIANFARFYETNLFLQHYFAFIANKSTITVPTNPVSLPDPKNVTVEFKNVSFGYSPEKIILKNISFTIPAGKNLALVGENGAGKTTLVKLLLRLYDPLSGEILLNGVNIKNLDPKDLRHCVSGIAQDFMRYEMTVKENIAMGDIEKIHAFGAIKKAAKLAGAAEFVEKFPDKYNQMLGKYFEKGEELSGGQWQKIALARAFFSNAPILILDEPTASLDPKSEYEVFKNLIAHTTHKSLILISHRFSTVRIADEIIVLHHGEIVEQGSHETLMKQNGRYAKLYNLQAKWYK